MASHALRRCVHGWRLAGPLLKIRDVNNQMSRIRRLALGLGLAGLGACAGTPGRPPETAPRIADSAPEKIAAQRAAMPGLRLEEDAQRWGIEEDSRAP